MLDVGTSVKNYTIVEHVGAGAYGEVYYVFNSVDSKMYAMKVESNDITKTKLGGEVLIYKKLNSAYFPHIYKCGRGPGVRYAVFEALGVSISTILKSGYKLSYEQFYCIATESLKALKEFHSMGMIHNDVKPGNFCLRPRSDVPLVLVDMGGSCYYKDPETNERYPIETQMGITYTKKYVSYNADKKQMFGPADDMYSWFLMMVDIFKRKLPWDKISDLDEICKIKRDISPKKLCRRLPDNFVKIYNLIISLKYEDDVDYNLIQKLLDSSKIGLKFVKAKSVWKGLMKEFSKEMYMVPEVTIQSTDYC